MYSNFTEEARKTLMLAKKEMNDLKHPYIGSEHLLLALLKNNNEVSKKLRKHNVTYDVCKSKIIDLIGIGKSDNKVFLYTTLVKRILESACLDSRDNNRGEVTDEHLMIALLEEGEGVAFRILIELEVDIEALYQEFIYPFQTKKKKNKNKLILEELGVDLNQKAKDGKLDIAIGRNNEIKQLIEILSRRKKNNPILIGEAGVGKTAIVEELARRIVDGNVPQFLKNKKIINLDMASAVSGTKYRGEFEERISKILKEIEENQNIILFIDEIHTIVGAGGAEGAIDASNIFKPALARGTIHCIGATTSKEYKKFIEKDSALERRFQKIEVREPNELETFHILKEIKPLYEKYHQVIINDEVLKLIVSLSNRYFYDRNQPDKAIDLLDEVCASVHLKESKNEKKLQFLEINYQTLIDKKNKSLKIRNFKQASHYKKLENNTLSTMNELRYSLINQKNKKVLKNDVLDIVERKTKIPIYEINGNTKQIIANFKKQINNTIVGQEKVLNKLIQVNKRIQCGYQEEKCHSFLFLGPSGVGKTMLAKSLAKTLFSSNIIKLDMSEYSEAHSVSKILGSPPGYVGYDDHNSILEQIRLHPYSVLILDELEKAHPSIINLLYQVLEDGLLKDASGKKVSFKHTMIIMTSNVGSLTNDVGFIKQPTKQHQELKKYFSIPFLNRLDYILTFDTLKEEDMKKIIQKKLSEVEKKYQVKIKKKVILEIIDESNYLEYGARRVDKIIQNGIIDQILDAKINKEEDIIINKLNVKKDMVV